VLFNEYLRCAIITGQFSFEHIKNSEFNKMRRNFSMIRDNAKTVFSQGEALKNDLRSIQKSRETGGKQLPPEITPLLIVSRLSRRHWRDGASPK
jgi:hypothetical protein